jgi:hypothetical protein
MTRNAAMELIVSLIERVHGCKAVYVSSLLEKGLKEKFTALAEYNVTDMIGDLVATRRLKEVQYILPGENEVRSFLLPIGSRVLEDVDEKETLAWVAATERARTTLAKEDEK